MESKNRNVVFRESIHGYNKKDVNDYIVRLSRDYFEKERHLKSELRKSELAVKMANDVKSHLEEDFTNLSNDVAEIEAKLAESNEIIAKLKDENCLLSSSVDDLKSANTTLRIKFEEFHSSVTAENKKIDNAAAPLYNRMSVDLFTDNRDFVSQFKVSSDVLDVFRSIMDKIKQSIKTATDCSSEEFSAAVNNLRVNTDNATKSADIRANETASRLELIRNELISSIDSEMDKIEGLLLK